MLLIGALVDIISASPSLSISFPLSLSHSLSENVWYGLSVKRVGGGREEIGGGWFLRWPHYLLMEVYHIKRKGKCICTNIGGWRIDWGDGVSSPLLWKGWEEGWVGTEQEWKSNIFISSYFLLKNRNFLWPAKVDRDFFIKTIYRGRFKTMDERTLQNNTSELMRQKPWYTNKENLINQIKDTYITIGNQEGKKGINKKIDWDREKKKFYFQRPVSLNFDCHENCLNPPHSPLPFPSPFPLPSPHNSLSPISSPLKQRIL